jgi:glucose-6-phosphate-specific signal transduction histidine kinase
MSSNTRPTKPRAPGRHVRQQIQDIEIDAGAIDRKLDRLAQTDIEASQAQGLARRILVATARLLGMGVDDDNGSNGHAE